MANDNKALININVDLGMGESLEKITDTIIEFCKNTFGLGTKEIGFFIQDKIRYQRWKWWNNVTQIIEKTKDMPNMDKSLVIHPRIFFNILDNGGWVDDENLQKMWAGLLVSGRTTDGKDQSNTIFINMLSQMTTSEVKILDYICGASNKILTSEGIVFAEDFDMTTENLLMVSGISDIQKLDLELDHLRSLGLITRPGGFMAIKGPVVEKFEIPKSDVGVTPSGLALNLYIRCKGYSQTPKEYFNLK